MYTTRWRLVYADDSVVDEQPEGSTIRDVPPLPIDLQLVRHDEEPPRVILRVPLNGERPIFYRWRSTDMGSMSDGGIRTEYLAIGRGHIAPSGEVESELWEWTPMTGAQPAKHVAEAAVEMLLGG